ncbi:dimethylamine monooxygenase subunit DmmA family protein [Agrobacterium sp. T29]|uniref:dimethylamine monooxygenase subunit DmmA family protein n=1 Tax=Agrobacterium sp. T29 TaxID=2580515 RepID=UPI00115D9153|nr:dimethylamine monooxygenase subunit DmmA family protein [Agrobacterium sp. T29]
MMNMPKPVVKYRHRIYSSSRPVYEDLRWSQAQDCLVICDSSGAPAVRALLAQPHPERLIVVQLNGGNIPGKDNLLAQASQWIDRAPAGSALLAAGEEPLLCALRRMAWEKGYSADAMILQRTGRALRDTRCAHCHTITSNVAFQAFTCSGCGRVLVVRDHYSIRLGAYIANMMMPEDPMIPEMLETALK